MADAITQKTQVASTIETIVAAQVQEVLTAQMVVPPTIMDLSSLVGPGMDTVKIPKFGHFTVATKAAGTAVDAQQNAFSSDDMSLDKHQVVQFLVEKIADLQSKIAFTQLYVEQAAKDMAAKMDLDIITAMAAGVSSSSPDHIIDFSNTPTDTISKGDFLQARYLLNVQNVPMSDRFALLAPGREKDVLGISEFVRVDESGGSAALRNGQIGKLFGFDVIVSSQAIEDGTLFYHKSAHCYARQALPQVAQESALAYLAQRWSIDHIWGQKHLDAGKRIVKVKDGGA
jgi:N4-gp56 family major capsid protein